MKIDELLHALTNIHQSHMRIDNIYSAAVTRRMLEQVNILRRYALENDSIGFANHCQSQLASNPDLMDSLLSALFRQLGKRENILWEEFAADFL